MNGNQATASKGVQCTNDVELHVLLLTCRAKKQNIEGLGMKKYCEARSLHGLWIM